MTVKYRGGATPESVIRGLQRQKVVAINEAEAIVSETADEALEAQRRFLDAATTRTGSERFASGQGGSAGRNDSGDLIAGTSRDVQRTSRSTIQGRWGWLGPFGVNPVGKIQAQELGGSPSNIPAARSLLDSYMLIRNKFIDRVRKLGR